MKEKIHTILFYKYVMIKKLESFRRQHLRFCKELGLLGKVLIAKEGINGSVSGTREQIERYKEHMKNDERFLDMNFKEDLGLECPFTKMQVKVRKEIVAFKEKVDLKNTGKHLSPNEVKELYENKKVGEDFIVLDARNDYEFKVGHFKNSIHLDIKTFRQFPKAIKKIGNLKDKKIVMCCTGGIRCEKASAFLKEEGFKDVSQMKDGIINYCKTFPDTFWEGSLFVFDKRLVTPINEKDVNPITECVHCGVPCDLYMNCRNVDCDDLFLACVECQKEFNNCCSNECLDRFRIQCDNKSRMGQGRRVRVEA